MKKLTLQLGAMAVAALLAAGASAQAPDATRLTPAKPGMPIAHPIAPSEIAAPPLSLVADRPKNPAYVAGLPALPQNRIVTDDYGTKRPKFDGVFIRGSKVENGQVVIPPGGLVFHEDTWGGEVALKGEPLPVLSRMPTYIDYDMSIVMKENVTIPAGQSVAVGGQVYQYYATVGHEQTANHALHVKTIAGTDWEWAFGSPVLSATQPGWWGMKFTQLYNQGQAREVTREKMVFDWISGVRMDRLLLAEDKVFAGLAKSGQEWKTGDKTIKVGVVDTAAGTVQIQVLDASGAVKLDKVLGPLQTDRLIEDTAARKALVFEHEGLAGYLVPGPDAFKDGQANLKLYAKAFSLKYGDTYAGDSRFAVYPVGCPTGHNFGFMLTNKEEIRIAQGATIDGPEKYFQVRVDEIANGEVRKWHVLDSKGNASANLGGAGVVNVDLVLGQGRVAGQAILKDVGRTMGVRMSDAVSRAQAPAAASQGALSYSALAAIAALILGVGGLAFELGRRKRVQA